MSPVEENQIVKAINIQKFLQSLASCIEDNAVAYCELYKKKIICQIARERRKQFFYTNV
jgi:hypothetical protein